MKGNIMIFLICLVYSFGAKSQTPQKVYGGVTIGVSINEYDVLVNKLLNNKELSMQENDDGQIIYAVDNLKGKLVYMHLLVSATNGRILDRLLVIASPRLEKRLYLRDMTQMKADIPEMLSHVEIRDNILKQLIEKYGQRFETKYSRIPLKNGPIINFETQSWERDNMTIELSYYSIGFFHKVGLVYRMKEVKKENRF